MLAKSTSDAVAGIADSAEALRPISRALQTRAHRASCEAELISAKRFTYVRKAAIATNRLRLSVVVPSFNTAAYVCAAVRSILRQTMGDLEVIVVDDGSSDDSLARISEIEDLRLTCVAQDNRGLSGARNTGIALSRAPYIGFCDSDDLWHPDKALRHLEIMEPDTSVGLTFSLSEYLTDQGKGTREYLVSSCAEPTTQDLVVRNHIGNGSTPVLRAECFELAGSFDEGLRACEDIEMWFRVALLTNFRLVRIASALTGYRVRGDSMTFKYQPFVDAASEVAKRFAELDPTIPSRRIARGFAESVRIASRKALSSGDVAASRALLKRAFAAYPLLFLSDGRACALLGYQVVAMCVPNSITPLLLRLANRAIQRVFALALSHTPQWEDGAVWESAGA